MRKLFCSILVVSMLHLNSFAEEPTTVKTIEKTTEKTAVVNTTKKYSNYSEEKKIFLNLDPQQKPSLSLLGMFKMMRRMLFDSSRRPSEILPEVIPDLEQFKKAGSKIKFIWFGHSTLLLNLDGKIILVDPVFGKTASPNSWSVKRFQAPVVPLEKLPEVDLILISHDHYDHLDKTTVAFFKEKNVPFITPLKVGEHLQDWGIEAHRITELDWGQDTTIAGIKVTATPAQHFSGRTLFDRTKTLWASFVIQGAQEKIYYSADTGYASHFKDIGQEYGPFDLAFMENGQYNEKWHSVHMLPDETIRASQEINAKLIVPIHWGMFDISMHQWNDPILEFYRRAQEAKIQFATPRIGEVVDLSQEQKNTQWWLGIK